MGQFNQTIYDVSLEAAGGADTVRVWDIPASSPITKLSITITSFGIVTGAGNITWQVFFGGTWNGTPFDYDGGTTHAGGIAQAAAAPIVGAVEYAHVVYVNANLIPANHFWVSSKVRKYGFPIVMELVNLKAVPVDFSVIFTREHSLTN